jgi:very-short-patch-repair endonuclease
MAAEKGRNPDRRVLDRADSRPEPDYVAKVASLQTICAFVRTHGGGDRAVAWVAGRQLGVIDTRQLHAAGLSGDAITTRCARRSMRRLHRGVYAVGPAALLPGAAELAALLATGRRSLISHRSAAALWGLTEARGEEIELTLVGGSCKRRGGLRVHRVQALHRRDRGTKYGLRVTAPARTLIDFASQATGDELERALSEAYALRLVTDPQVFATVERSALRPGVGALRRLTAAAGGPVITRSKAGRRTRGLLRAARLPTPASNIRVAGYEADLLWPEHRLIVEFDGYHVHGHRAAFERDRRRDAALVAWGYRVIRITWLQLENEPFAIVANIAMALAA